MDLEDLSLWQHTSNSAPSTCLLIRIWSSSISECESIASPESRRCSVLGPKISSSAAAQPEGLLRHETIIYSLFPMHLGMRQYWRDAKSLLEWTRSDPHRQWWQSFLKNSGGTGFWQETYFRRGGIEAVYDDVPENIGMMTFAPVIAARGPMFGAATRAEKEFGVRPVLSEEELYGEPEK